MDKVMLKMMLVLVAALLATASGCGRKSVTPEGADAPGTVYVEYVHVLPERNVTDGPFACNCTITDEQAKSLKGEAQKDLVKRIAASGRFVVIDDANRADVVVIVDEYMGILPGDRRDEHFAAPMASNPIDTILSIPDALFSLWNKAANRAEEDDLTTCAAIYYGGEKEGEEKQSMETTLQRTVPCAATRLDELQDYFRGFNQRVLDELSVDEGE